MTDKPPEPNDPSEPGLRGVLADLDRLAREAETVSMAALVRTIGARGHGPLILILSGLMLLPTGMLPLMPALIGVLLALIAIGMIVGDKGLSLPARIRRVEIPSASLRTALHRAAPAARQLHRILRPRLGWLAHGTIALTAIALTLLGVSAVMIVIGAIPGLPFVLCVPVLLFGLGLTAEDGVAVGLGFIATAAAILVTLRLVSGVAGLWNG